MKRLEIGFFCLTSGIIFIGFMVWGAAGDAMVILTRGGYAPPDHVTAAFGIFGFLNMIMGMKLIQPGSD